MQVREGPGDVQRISSVAEKYERPAIQYAIYTSFHILTYLLMTRLAKISSPV